ncbi:tetratricopeptide repeat protein [Streptomyces sp. NPDC057428]|uniref:tetratricopeptide repeat protein n=1 Tax=Streptomyces sp. NPDC057428 TaxID=3346129 RepID=UPI0036C411C9
MTSVPSGARGAGGVSGSDFTGSAVQIGDGNIQHIHQRVSAVREFYVMGRLPEVAPRVGRRSEVRQALDWLKPGAGVRGPLVIHGPAGAGKTHLAYAVAQEARRGGWFDGEIQVTVGNRPTEQYDSVRALNQVLRMLDPEAPPSPPLLDPEEARARYLARLGGRRVLVVVDGAAHADQVVSLLPPSPGRLVVTSRAKLTGLNPAPRHLGLGPLPPGDAVALLSAVLGASSGARDERIAGDPSSAAAVTDLCDRLPFALMLAAQILVARERMTVRELRDRLADRSRRLTELEGGARGVKAALEESFRLLSPADQALLRLLPSHPGPYIGADAVAALARIEPSEAADRLHALYYLRFLEHGDPYQGGFRFQDLVLLYAEELADAVPQAQRDAAALRLLRHYVAKTADADRELSEGSTTAMTWLDAERPNLVAAVLHAGTRPLLRADAVKLTLKLTRYFDVRKYWDDWVRTHRLTAGLAGPAGQQAHASTLLKDLGRAYHQQGLTSEAYHCYTEAVRMLPAGARFASEVLTVLRYRALCEMYDVGDTDLPVSTLEALLAVARALASEVRAAAAGGPQPSSIDTAEVAILINLGVAETRDGRPCEALRHFNEARRLSGIDGDRQSEGRAWLGIGNLHHRLEDLDRARRAYEKASACFAGLDDFGRGQAEYNLADLHITARHARRTRRHLNAAADAFARVPSEEARRWEQLARRNRQHVGLPVVSWSGLTRPPAFAPLGPLPALPPPFLAMDLPDIHPDTPERMTTFVFPPPPDPHFAAPSPHPPGLPDDLPDRGLPHASEPDTPGALTDQEPPDEAADPSELLAPLGLSDGTSDKGDAHAKRDGGASEPASGESRAADPPDIRESGYGSSGGHDSSYSSGSYSSPSTASSSRDSHEDRSGHDSDGGGYDRD